MKKVIPWFSIILLTVAIALSGCGAGGSSSTGGTTPPVTENPSPTPEPPVVTKKVSGVAAAGAPMIGWAYLKDSSNPATTLGPAEIAADGSFSFDVTNLKAPFYLQAEGTVGGQGYKLHSVAMSDGTANINPLTDLAVAAAAGVNDPAEVYNNPSANSINSAALDKAIADIQAMLLPLLDVYSVNTNFLSGAYTADHTGLDGVLDVVEVSIDTTTGDVSVNDKIAGEQIAAMTTTTIEQPADTINSTEAGQSISVPSDLQGIATLLSNFATTYNKGASLKAVDLDPYFASDSIFGIGDGFNRTQTIQEWLQDASGCDNCISSISGVYIKEKKENGDYTDYIIGVTVHTTDGSIYTDAEFNVTNEEEDWKFKGNGYKSNVELSANLEKYVYSDGKSSIASGLRIDVEDEGNWGLQSATITGPGLPEEGIKMAKGATDAVDMDPDPVTWKGYRWEFWHIYPMTDAEIEALEGKVFVYSIEVRDINGAHVETRTVTLPKRPFKVSEVNSGYFPQVSGIANHNTSSLNLGGGTLSLNYTKPTAYPVASMNIEVGYSSSTGWDSTEIEQSPNGTSVDIVTLGLPDGTVISGGWLREDVWDLYGREVTVQWEFSPTSNTLFNGGGGSTASKSSIVGSWGNGITGSDVLSLTFYPDGTYIHWEKNNYGSGVEYGTYTYDADTQTLTATSTVDENYDASGLTGYAGETTVASPVIVSSDTITFPNDEGSPYVFNRVVDANQPIVGSWYIPDNDKPLSLTFYSSGDFIIWDYFQGVEYGTYSHNPDSYKLTVTATVDEQGSVQEGMTYGPGNTRIMTVTVAGDKLTIVDGDTTHTFNRVKEPPAILGTWYGGNPTTRDFGSVTFFDDGTYIMAEDGVADSGGQAGMEHGIYTWDPATGVFTASASLDDTSGDWGLSHLMGGDTFTISGNTLTMNFTVEGTYTATRLLPDAGNPIVGTWYGGDPNISLFYLMSFFADGTYIMADNDDTTINTDPDNPICHPGMELGTYAWNPVTGAFSANPIYRDTNGECGFSTGDGIGETATVTINGNTLTMDFGDSAGVHQITRVVP